MKKLYVAGAGFVIILGLFALNNIKPVVPVQSGKIQVITSFYPLYFFASQIAGDKVDIFNITPAGAEPHDYEPTAQDIARMEGSQVIILNGGHLEPWGDNIQKNNNPQRTTIVTAGEGLATQDVVEDGESIIDPHIWLSPTLAIKMVERIGRAIETADPSNAIYYDSNVQALKAKLVELDREYFTGLISCVQKNIITSHSAFGYLATAYHLNQVSIAGLSPDAEPSPKEVADIAKFAKSNDIKYIFFESLVSPKLSETIATEIGAQTLVLNPIEGLSKAELAQGKDYITEMRANLSNLQIALQCKK